MSADLHTVQLNDISAHLDSLSSLLFRLADGSEGDCSHGEDLGLAGTFYSIGNSIVCEKGRLDAIIDLLEKAENALGATGKGGAA